MLRQNNLILTGLDGVHIRLLCTILQSNTSPRQTLIKLEDSRLTTVHRDFINLVYVFQPLAERQMGEQQLEALQVTDEYGVHLTEITLHHEGPLPLRQVWPLTQFFSVSFL